MKVFKIAVIIACAVFSICFIVTAAMIIRETVYDMLINDNVESMTHNIKYQDSQKVSGIAVKQQEITCGYRTIEMVAEYLGYDSVTEQSLFKSNNEKVSTSTNSGFYKEIKKQLPDYQITERKDLKNTEMIDIIYNSLANKMPVVICFAAKDKNLEESEQKWTLHYSVVVGIDVAGAKITVDDTYGYKEVYSLEDFLASTRFASYENMDFYLKMGFAFGLFNKNTIYTIEKPEAKTVNISVTE